MTSRIEYLGQLRTTAEHLRSKTTLLTDAPVDNNGKGEAFSPTDLVATALGSCMLTIMAIAAEKKDINFKGADVEIEKIMEASPRRIGEIKVNVKMNSANYSEEDKAYLERVAKRCPVALSLHPDTKQTINFHY